MKIKYLPLQPNCFSFGGFEIQIANNLKANTKAGLDISRLDVWDRSNDFEVLHCWGLGFPNFENVMAAKKANKKVVLSILLYDYDTLFDQLKFKLSAYIGIQRFLIKMLAAVDAVSVVNELQAKVCHTLYKVPESKIHVIPNVVDSKYFDLSKQIVNGTETNFKDYVLVVGNVCKRKNQVNLAQACTQKNINLMIIGKVMDGEADYGNSLKGLVQQHHNLKWVEELKENSDDLIQHYRNSVGVVLPSSTEQQPLSTLEGAILGKPILLGDCTYAKQRLFRNACLVNPHSIDDIAKGVEALVRHPQQYLLDSARLQDCHESKTSAAYHTLYNSL